MQVIPTTNYDNEARNYLHAYEETDIMEYLELAMIYATLHQKQEREQEGG